MKPLIPNPTDLTYIEDSASLVGADLGFAVCLDEASLAWMCESEVEAYRAAIRHVDLIRDELVAKLEDINGEIYRND